jgi:hypothetical protein
VRGAVPGGVMLGGAVSGGVALGGAAPSSMALAVPSSKGKTISITWCIMH